MVGPGPCMKTLSSLVCFVSSSGSSGIIIPIKSSLFLKDLVANFYKEVVHCHSLFILVRYTTVVSVLVDHCEVLS